MAKSDPSQERAASLLLRMLSLKHHSYFSLAYHSLARYRFAQKFQSRPEIITALKDLIWFDGLVVEKFQILNGELNDAIWSSLLKEQIQEGRYAEALETYEELSNLLAGKEMPFSDSIAQIYALKESDQIVQRAISIPASGYTHLPLLKNSFTFIDVEGSITDLRLRCDAQFTELKFQVGAEYQVPKKWGNCNLQIVGSVGTIGKNITALTQ